MAIQLDLSIKERKLLRFAGLLHDIGHYPLSHVCEFPYKKPFALLDVPDEEFCKETNTDVISRISGFSIDTKTTLMSKSTGRHHEAIGGLIVQNNKEIRDILIKECEEPNAPQIISDIITGNVERAEITDPLLVQIIHSEIDADGIDYLMRGAMFSGTSFGNFEIEQLIRCLTEGTYQEKRILSITPKGIAAADQYLINKFFSYSQVVFNKHIVISEWMAEQVVNWMQKHRAIFPNGATLETWVKGTSTSENYLSFTDNLFWTALESILTNELHDLVPHYIKVFCRHLLHHNEPVMVPSSELRMVSNDKGKIKDHLMKAELIQNPEMQNQHIAILSTRNMSNQVPYDEFLKAVKSRPQEPERSDEEIKELEVGRLMEGVCVKEADGSLHLLCDDERSLMQHLYNINLVVLRSYEFPNED